MRQSGRRRRLSPVQAEEGGRGGRAGLNGFQAGAAVGKSPDAAAVAWGIVAPVAGPLHKGAETGRAEKYRDSIELKELFKQLLFL